MSDWETSPGDCDWADHGRSHKVVADPIIKSVHVDYGLIGMFPTMADTAGWVTEQGSEKDEKVAKNALHG